MENNNDDIMDIANVIRETKQNTEATMKISADGKIRLCEKEEQKAKANKCTEQNREDNIEHEMTMATATTSTTTLTTLPSILYIRISQHYQCIGIVIVIVYGIRCLERLNDSVHSIVATLNGIFVTTIIVVSVVIVLLLAFAAVDNHGILFCIRDIGFNRHILWMHPKFMIPTTNMIFRKRLHIWSMLRASYLLMQTIVYLAVIAILINRILIPLEICMCKRCVGIECQGSFFTQLEFQ